jgi:hypothetical protein
VFCGSHHKLTCRSRKKAYTDVSASLSKSGRNAAKPKLSTKAMPNMAKPLCVRVSTPRPTSRTKVLMATRIFSKALERVGKFMMVASIDI